MVTPGQSESMFTNYNVSEMVTSGQSERMFTNYNVSEFVTSGQSERMFTNYNVSEFVTSICFCTHSEICMVYGIPYSHKPQRFDQFNWFHIPG